ncbi:hypothetical protein FNF27_03759 [Cafeteria roenbergensis]|uniref:Uncharacterized protein n=2 Tax=Cafeteria roenbergensis TaxID=33653 RepID=A0A5A8E2E3_CAFRO|nr:hypothetical protein FNF29_06272 [Cafeteria roenbergensis]KAA0160080.1 hypothetical protein FNF31_04538 [Cafeteria roenbergensis]KAA0170997.1 hypothetical protein FNF28_01003 [Cafeteria roenbergensis]KAA0174644.1 hypothetical protein FNF27_03759 [Cafeteria roenbergensis]|eukprot:KAA0148980.1 hypothetical protein FNF29_06272 [Cafeteria roenbergensis]
MALRSSKRAGKTVAAVGALLVAGGFASIPFLFTKSQVRLTDKEGSLTGTQIQRGAFLNSGSKDVGVDPDWDLKTGTYKKAGTSFNPSEEDVAKFRRQHGMRDPLEVERLLKERRAAKAGASRTE